MGVSSAAPASVPHAAEREVLGGSALVFAAEGLALPAGLAVTALLTRHLAPAEYGVFAIAATGTAWLEWTILSLMARASYKLVAEADDWRPVASAVLRAHLLAGIIAGALLFAASEPLAALFGVPALTTVLRVFALDVPLFMLAHAHRGVLVGLGAHRGRAWTAASRWVLRAILAGAAVLLAAPLWGVAALLTVATLGELLVSRRHVRPSLFSQAAPPLRHVFRYATPLIVTAMCIRLIDRVDLFALRLLGGSLESVGAYGVAQNLALGPGIFGQAFAPAVIAMLSARLRRGDEDGIRRGATNSLRLGVLLLGFTLLAAGAAPGLVRTFFGDSYAGAALPFALLGVAATAMLVLSLATAILLATDHLYWAIYVTIPALLLALVAHLAIIPRFGAAGAAAVSMVVAVGAAAAASWLVRRRTGARFPVATLARALLCGAAVASLALLWPLRGVALFVQLTALSALLAAMLVALGELTPSDRTRLALATARFRRSIAQ